MEHRYEPQPSHEGEGHEPERSVLPQIYVTSLADYVNGDLHGRWIDATQDIDDINASVHAMLETSPTPGAEEYAIHDFEGFGPLTIGEYQSLESVARIAKGIEEHGEAFAYWIDATGVEESDYHTFSDSYLGHWDSMTAYAEELIDDFDIYRQLEALSLPFDQYIHIDIESLTRDLKHDYTIAEDDTGIHLWSNR